MEELIFPLQELGNPDFEIQVDQVHRMGEFIHRLPSRR